jgi:ureidoglycolate lyase
MKLLRIGAPGAEKPAMLDPEGGLRDLSAAIPDIAGAALSPTGLRILASLDWRTLPKVAPGGRIGPCVARPLNFVCIGLNYADHAAETGAAIPKEPIVFLKSLGAFCGPNDDVVIPRGSQKTDWEVELGVVIGSRARYVSEADAMDHVAGYCVVNDVSERAFQSERGGTWDKGKGCDTFGPTGPWLVTADEIADPQNLAMWLDVDGKRMQNGSTRTMIFGVRALVSYVSHFITLHPGDIISTGTPPGVGLGMKPEPVYLRPGQVMRLSIAGLGEQQQRVVAADTGGH